MAEQERALHNGGPIEEEQKKAIEALKALHRELGELIRCAEQGLPLDAHLAALRTMKNGTFRWCKETLGLLLVETPLVASSSVLGCGVMTLVNTIVKGTGEAGIAMGAAAVAVHSAGVLQRRSRTAR